MADENNDSAPTSNPTVPEKTTEKPETTGNPRNFPETLLPSPQLTHPQRLAVQFAADGVRWYIIARRIGVDTRTLFNWHHENVYFQEALAAARAERLETASSLSHSLAEHASEVLGKILDDPTDKNRVRAAQILLQHSARLTPKQSSKKDDDEDEWPMPELPPKVG